MNRMLIDRISDQATAWIGSTASLVVHTILFAASFASHWLLGLEFDTILLTVTTVVSLEAIYISIFIQRAVNQQGARLIDVEEDIAEVDHALDDVEKALDDVEEALDEVEESLTEQEEDIADIPTDTIKQLEQPLRDILVQMKGLVEEMQDLGEKKAGKEKK